MHLDELFMYETTKKARIQDRRLGLTYYAFVLLIVSYVVGYQIFFLNEHFRRRDVYGTARMTIQQPTKRCNPNKVDCKSDFHSQTELPYCKVYTGDSDEVDVANRHPCIFADQHTLMPQGMLEGSMLVPTRIDTMKEVKGCEPGPSNEYTCDNEYFLQKEQEVVYVADIERYTILVAHTFRRGHIKGNNQQMRGYLWECQEDEGGNVLSNAMKKTKDSLLGASTCNGKYVKTPIECITGSCQFSEKEKEKESFLQKSGQSGGSALPDAVDKPHRHRSHREDWREAVNLAVAADGGGKHDSATSDKINPAKLAAGGVFAIPDGDVFSIAKLLEICGLSLDKTFNLDGEPLREAGTVIEIEAIYSNLHAFLSTFGWTEVGYFYKISQRPMEEMKTELYAAHQPNFPQERLIENRHGLYIVVKIGGEFGFFSIVFLLVMLTMAVALVGAATAVTDKLMIYVMERKEEYLKLKYDYSERMTGEDEEDDSFIAKGLERLGVARRGHAAAGDEEKEARSSEEAKT